MREESIAFFDKLEAERQAKRATLSGEELQAFDLQLDELEKRGPIVDELMAADPKLSPISAFIIAGDKLSSERSKRWVEEGLAAEDAISFVGSFGRLDFIVWALERGDLDETWLLHRWPDYWRGADPHDTDKRFLDIWTKAWRANGYKPIVDERSLPRKNVFHVYRGQEPDEPLGIAWTLDKRVAEKFARGAGVRASNRAGVVLELDVPKTAIIAYLTGRNEEEVILPTLGITIEEATKRFGKHLFIATTKSLRGGDCRVCGLPLMTGAHV